MAVPAWPLPEMHEYKVPLAKQNQIAYDHGSAHDHAHGGDRDYGSYGYVHARYLPKSIQALAAGKSLLEPKDQSI